MEKEPETETLIISTPEAMTENYNRIYEIYCSMGFGQRAARDITAVEDLTSILSIGTTDAKVAMYGAWDIFNTRARQRVSINRYAGKNYFENTSERKARRLLIEALNRYIRHLESHRYGYNKIATLFSFMIHKGLYNLISEIYIPEVIRPNVDSMIASINDGVSVLIKSIEDYFSKYENKNLNSIIKSLGRLLVSQRSDQIIENLKSFEPRISYEDQEFLQEKRDQYLDYANGPKLGIAKSMFGISDGSYYRNINQIISDLTEVLDEDSVELLTDLFIRG